jgi:hypothetical protein
MAAPRTVSPPPEEMVKIGERMVEWCKKNDPLHITEWYSVEEGYTDKAWDTMIRREEFIPYYQQAKRIIGRKYLDKNSNVRESAAHRWQRNYFDDLKQAEDDEFKQKETIKANLAKEAQVVITEDQKKYVEAIINQFQESRKDSSANAKTIKSIE